MSNAERNLPEEISGYRILAAIARGASGLVYRAEQPNTGRIVAVKLLLDGIGQTDRQKAWSEFDVLSRLDHPGIAAVLESGSVDLGLGPQPFFAMEFVDGQPLDQAAEKLALRARVELIRDVCEAIEHAHQRGVIHRDLKPDNILVVRTAGAEATVKILDFGIAQTANVETRQLAQRTGIEDLAGSLPFLSPDQIQLHQDQLDVRVDVYALGALLYCLISGRRPIDLTGLTMMQALEANCEQQPTRLGVLVPEARGDLEAIVHTAMAKQRDERYATAADLAADLKRWLRGDAVLARAPSHAEQLWRFARRRRVPIAATALIAAAMIAAIVVVRSQARIANASVERFESLAVSTRLARARIAATTLQPPWPSKLPAMRNFLVEYGQPLQAAQAQLRDHRATVARAAPAAGSADRFLLDRLGSILEDIDTFLAPETGALSKVHQRMQWAETVQARSITEQQTLWNDTVAALAQDGLELEPQVGLIPLGPDPNSGLQEFGHLGSGTIPTRDPATGKLQFDADSGLVFVLLPGSTFSMGAQANDPSGPNYDPRAGSSEGPIHEVTLAPYFVSKFELSAAQWQRLGSTARRPPTREDLADRPKHSVDWHAADRRLTSWGLSLPTEAQWEFAARAGSADPYWTGTDREALVSASNLREVPKGKEVEFAGPDGWTDGYRELAPIDSMLANPFGLHHTIGNVSEWCLDWRTTFAGADVAPATGEHIGMSSGEKTYRSGSYAAWLEDARVTRRLHGAPTHSSVTIGVRPVRAISP